jgi:hypothetical protein
MCHEYAKFSYLERDVTERMEKPIRERPSAPAPASGPTGGLVVILRGLFEKFRPSKTTVPAE